MKYGYRVKVSDSPLPKFPPSCVVCGQQHRGEFGIIEMTRKGHIPFVWFFMANIIKISEKHHILQIPGHKKCVNRLRRNFWLRNIMLVLVALAIATVGIINNWGKFYTAIVGLIICAPFIYWELSHPLPIEYDHNEGEYVFTL